MQRIPSAFLTVLLLCSSVGALGATSPTAAPASPSYDMRSTETDLWDQDVDYFSPPILLQRTKDTYELHRLNFQTLRYVQECVYWQQVCVQYNNHGQCIAWENRCAQWDYRSYPINRRIELNFHSLPKLADGQTETYQVTISRMRPTGEGDDSVSTWFEAVSTQKPVKVLKLGEYQYSIDLKN